MKKIITSKAFFSPQHGFTLRYLTLAGPLISGKSEMPMTLNPGRMVVVVNRRVELIISKTPRAVVCFLSLCWLTSLTDFYKIREIKMRVSVWQTLGALSTVAEIKTNNKESLKKLEGKGLNARGFSIKFLFL